ncbi:multiple RNA-binding domain-containing protein 1-like isoform X2 [Hydra vulgaris]|uniref:Multiple RNA-binding domain-containing protein 1-like isoform X2 n=1 Tax=Hydra vulgaris TaxID=6087 RepID=A0ABM4D520_HYDVU
MEIPLGFESFKLQTNNTLSVKDFDYAKEIALISVPEEFDVTDLKGSSFVVDGTIPLKCSSESNAKKWEIYSYAAPLKQQANILFPSQDGTPAFGPPISVYLNIAQCINLPYQKKNKKIKKNKLETPDNLCVRWKPFGSDEPYKKYLSKQITTTLKKSHVKKSEVPFSSEKPESVKKTVEVSKKVPDGANPVGVKNILEKNHTLNRLKRKLNDEEPEVFSSNTENLSDFVKPARKKKRKTRDGLNEALNIKNKNITNSFNFSENECTETKEKKKKKKSIVSDGNINISKHEKNYALMENNEEKKGKKNTSIISNSSEVNDECNEITELKRKNKKKKSKDHDNDAANEKNCIVNEFNEIMEEKRKKKKKKHRNNCDENNEKYIVKESSKILKKKKKKVKAESS